MKRRSILLLLLLALSVTTMAQEVREEKPAITYRPRGYFGYVEASGGAVGWPFLGVSTSHGFRFNPKLFVGGGMSLNTEGLSLFSNVRYNFTPKQTSPFLDGKLGCNVWCIDSPEYITLSVGVTHQFDSKWGLSFSMGYIQQDSEKGWAMHLGFEF